MMLLTLIVCLFLAGCTAAPKNDGFSNLEMVLKPDLFNETYVLYTSQYDIVRISVPLNQFNGERTPYKVFFVEGEYKDDGVIYKGLSVFEGGDVISILDNGRDIVETKTSEIYIGAGDGIYKYNNVIKVAKKHGKVTDSIRQLTYNVKTNSIYYLTDDNEVYKLNEDATASDKVTELTDVQEMACGFEGKLYYYNSKKEFYVVDFEEGVVSKEITGLPENMNKFVLMPPSRGSGQGVLLFADNVMYDIRNQNVERVDERSEVTLTALAPQPLLVHFYAKDKKLYAFSFRVFLLSGAMQPKQ